jgi:hypothetical protein
VAITGQNTASRNTGSGNIITGDANIAATTVNIANTTVKNGSLFVAVVNIFGDWLGDLLYGGSSLLAASGQGGGPSVTLNAGNSQTGSDSENTIEVDVHRSHETHIDNMATISTLLNADIDTGSNRANKNTGGGTIATGNGALALHGQNIANVTAAFLDGGMSLEVTGANDTTGYNSQNAIRATVNDERVFAITNLAHIATFLPALINTGNNEARWNTLGGLIDTGDAAAHAALRSLVNQVVLAMGTEAATLDAELSNSFTGAVSDNTNDVEFVRSLLAGVVNEAILDTLLDLLLHTGGNVAKENTGGGAVYSGAACVEGDIHQEANTNSIAGATSLTLDNDAQVATGANVFAETGNNETSGNTGAFESEASGDESLCNPVVAQAPEVSPTPTQSNDSSDGDDNEGEDRDEDESDDEEDERVGGVGGGRDESLFAEVGPKFGQVLRRFPVAGGSRDILPQSSEKNPLALIAALSAAALLALAVDLDRRAQKHNVT